LTLSGYSLTDTVVVFDRIRENLRFRHKDTIANVINSGINQVLSRTLVVSLTVVLVLVALFFFGGEVIHDFSLALLLGVFVGTFSSIFVASPLLVIWPKAKGQMLK
jgi:preprotein translocase subunit SecF